MRFPDDGDSSVADDKPPTAIGVRIKANLYTRRNLDVFVNNRISYGRVSADLDTLK